MKSFPRLSSGPASLLLRMEQRMGMNRRLYGRYVDAARSAGLDRLYLILSLDCDSEADIPAVAELHDRLTGMGLRPVYAVPGKLLEKGHRVYGDIYAKGGIFLNHGYADHGNPSRMVFYDRMGQADVAEDIRLGHEAVRRVLGCTPRGFRAPHFGTFQRPRQLDRLYAELGAGGYLYSSSTMPVWGIIGGPRFNVGGITEFPVSGTWSRPLVVLDSWGWFAAPGRARGGDDYAREAANTADWFSGTTRPAGILNYYVDPSHVSRSTAFFDSVRAWLAVAEPCTYEDLLEQNSYGR